MPHRQGGVRDALGPRFPRLRRRSLRALKPFIAPLEDGADLRAMGNDVGLKSKSQDGGALIACFQGGSALLEQGQMCLDYCFQGLPAF